jgi:sugar transferase (PEP-CTERM system associated)
MIRVFRHYIPASLLVLGIVEALAFFSAMYAGVILRLGVIAGEDIEHFGGGTSPLFPIWPKAVLYALVMLGTATALGLYQRDFRSRDEQWIRIMAAFGVGLVAMFAVFYILPQTLLGRGVLLLTHVVAFVGVCMARAVYFGVTGASRVKRRVLVLGTGTRAAKVDSLEKHLNGTGGFIVVGYIPTRDGHHFVEKSKLLSDAAPLCAIAHKHDIDEIVIGVRDRRGGLPMDDVLACKMNGVDVIDLPSFFERETGHVQLQTLNPSWMIFSEGFGRSVWRDRSKRIFDIASSLVLLLITSPFIVLTAALIALESGMPIFYRQQRVGHAGKSFDVLKFRSMRTDAEKDGKPKWASLNDDRVTRVGKVVRKLRIDELPQIFNVLRGDMSFVGPRPERPFFVEQLANQIPFYSFRHHVKPGITGWAQIRYPYGATVEDAIEKVQYDLYYVKNHTMFLDLVILFQTAQVVIFGKGAR